MAMQGYRTHEPVEIAPEEPSPLREIINLHLNQLDFSEAELCELMVVTKSEARNRYFQTERKLRLVGA